jgi:hypothetical protein
MPRPRKWGSDAERQKAYRDRRGKSARLPVFIAVDGEGTGRGAAHRYVLLGVGLESVDSGMGDDLGFDAIMDFLYAQYRASPGAVFVGFFLGYDFNRWLRLLPADKARRLFDPSLRARKPVKCVDKSSGEVYYTDHHLGPFPVTYQGWEFDILGSRRFKLRPEGGSGWMFICDAGPFFQTSLLKAIDPRGWRDPIVTPEEYKTIEKGKENRDSAVLDSDMRRYNALENDVLPRLLGRLDQGFRKAGVRLGKEQWFGPGQAAQAWLDHVSCPDRAVVRGAVARDGAVCDPLDLGRLAYYGGWFEIFAHGIIPGDSFEYDINSAYPHVIRSLPCLLHGSWHHDLSEVGRDVRPDSYRLVHARVVGSDPVCGGMLHRRPDHSILRPSSTGGWYWTHELAAGIRAGVIDRVDVEDGYRYDPCGCQPPLRGLAGLYDERLRVGKDTPEGKAYKMLYNSVYGKFAQNVGKPKYSNYVYASLITAGCRSMILDAIATHPGGTGALLMVATDGVYFRDRHPSLPVSDRLGEWGEARKRDLTLFKPGVYWDDDTRKRIEQDEDPRFKARGVNARDFAKCVKDIDDQFSRWQPGDVWPSAAFTTSFSMTTCVQALQRGKWETAGTVGSLDVTQDSDPSTKRTGPVRLSGGIWRSTPYTACSPLESQSYREGAAGVDHDQYGITDDGTVEDSWRMN